MLYLSTSTRHVCAHAVWYTPPPSRLIQPCTHPPQVLATKDWTKWDWDVVDDIVQDILPHPPRLVDALRTKWIKRVSGFYRFVGASGTSIERQVGWYASKWLPIFCVVSSVRERSLWAKAKVTVRARWLTISVFFIVKESHPRIKCPFIIVCNGFGPLSLVLAKSVSRSHVRWR